jgi:CubicO group peptidase (beta-lactamase class C family)
MTVRHRRFATAFSVLGFAVVALGAAGLKSQSAPPPADRVPPPAFTDPQRVEKLESALPEIDRLFRAFAERSRVPGIAYGIVIDGRLAHSGAAGYRDVGTKSPVDADTVFRIASMTKSFTALCIMRLRDEGKLSLDDPAERYVPELAGLNYPTADSPRITIRHLLSHAEGFPEDNPWGDRQLAATDPEMGAMMTRGIPFSTAPGTAYEYSNFGFAILGRIVASVSGVPYRQYVQANILKPLGMTSTTLEAADVPAGRLAHGYRFEGAELIDEPALPDGAFGPMGGMLTSTRDLAAYVGFFASAWPPRDDPDTGPVRRASLREMQQVWRPSPATVSRNAVDTPLTLNAGGYGFGLRVWQTCGFRHVVAHSGGLPGFGSHMRWLPEHGVALIAMGNLTYTSWGRVADDALDALERTGGLKPRTPRPSAALTAARMAVNRLIDRWDDGEAKAIAADNLFLDAPIEPRRKQLEAIRARLGACQADGAFDVENALRGTWKMACERGFLRVAITLAPTVPPKVQFWEITPVGPLPPAIDAAVKALTGMIGTPDRPALTGLLDAGADADAVARQLRAASAWGSCRVDDVLSGGSDRGARVRLACARGSLELAVEIDPASAKVKRVALVPAGTGACVP